jgi:hypothetical protein
MPDYARIVLAWLPAAAFSLHCKLVMLQLEGFRLSALRMGLAGEADLSAWEKLGFFRMDILLVLGAAPALLLVLGALLPRRAGVTAAGMVSAFVLLVQYAQIRAYLSVGQFLSLDLLLSAMRWGWENPGDILQYDSPSSLAKAGALLGFISVVVLAPRMPWEGRSAGFFATGRGVRTAWCAAAAVLFALPWIPPGKGGVYHSSQAYQSIRRLFPEPEGPPGEFSGLAAAELMAEYRSIAAARPRTRDPVFWGAAEGFNLVLVVLETAPSACLPLGDSISGFPHLESLRKASMVGLEHHSTYPYTNRAVFSLFTSLYPSNRAKGFFPISAGSRLPGIMRSLAGLGYATAAYFPIRQTFESDERMFEAFGIAEQRHPPGQPSWRPGDRVGWRQVMARDEAALGLLLTDIAGWSAAGRPFAAAFLPQVGHGPWQDVAGSGETEVLARGREHIRLQDAMIGRILAALESSGQAEKTLLVVTGDHGLRTGVEYPPLRGGLADSISFHVPLLVHARGKRELGRTIPWLTSHIDIAPTVLDLLGVEPGRDFEQGLPLWDPRIRERATYFFGRHYSGVDAYHQDCRFFMWNHTTATGYRNESALHFRGIPPLAASSMESGAVAGHLRRIASLQASLLDAVLDAPDPEPTGSRRNSIVVSGEPRPAPPGTEENPVRPASP